MSVFIESFHSFFILFSSSIFSASFTSPFHISFYVPQDCLYGTNCHNYDVSSLSLPTNSKETQTSFRLVSRRTSLAKDFLLIVLQTWQSRSSSLVPICHLSSASKILLSSLVFPKTLFLFRDVLITTVTHNRGNNEGQMSDEILIHYDVKTLILTKQRKLV